MGAFENQVYENETFDSLVELYRNSLDKIAELRADLVWALRHSAHLELSAMQSGLDLVAVSSYRVPCDNTDADILRAVREARRGDERS